VQHVDLRGKAAILSEYLGNCGSSMTPSPDGKWLAFTDWAMTGNVWVAEAFLSTLGDESVPDCQFEMAPAIYFNEGLSAPSDHACTMTTTLLKPTSRGCVTLRSARPDAKPRINHNYLTTTQDRATIIASVRLAMDLFAQPTLSRSSARPSPFPHPKRSPTSLYLLSSRWARTIILRALARWAASSTLIYGFSAPQGCV